MKWELLTAPEFEKARDECNGVCLLPIGVIEKHGDHLPLGQDIIYIHEVCTRAAENEKAMVFPYFYFGQIFEARHCPGTIAIKSDLILKLLDNICSEIYRNGFKKILIVNGHGGNTFLLKNYCLLQLEEEKDYMVYVSDLEFKDKNVEKIQEAKLSWHAGERETSSMLYIRPDLVKDDKFEDYGMPLGRLEKFKEEKLECPMWWYADFPGHLACDKVDFTKEKGKVFVDAHINNIVKHIKLVKEDNIAIELYKEFHKKAKRP